VDFNARTTTTDSEQLRATRGLRTSSAEEGSAAERLPNTVYGFTYSPAEAMPLFTTWHSFGVTNWQMARCTWSDL
jgi:hypothetical protein